MTRELNKIIETIKENYGLPEDKLKQSLVKEFNFSESEARKAVKEYLEINK